MYKPVRKRDVINFNAPARARGFTARVDFLLHAHASAPALASLPADPVVTADRWQNGEFHSVLRDPQIALYVWVADERTTGPPTAIELHVTVLSTCGACVTIGPWFT